MDDDAEVSVADCGDTSAVGWMRRRSDYAFFDNGGLPVAMGRRCGGLAPPSGRVVGVLVGGGAPSRRVGELLTRWQEIKIDGDCRSRLPVIGLPVGVIKDHRVDLFRGVVTAGRLRRAAP